MLIQLKKVNHIICCIAVLVTAMSFKVLPEYKTGNVIKIEFKNYVGNEILKLDSVTYKNESGQFYTISKLKYYIGNIHLRKADNKEIIFKDYFLVNEEDSNSKQIILNNIPDGEYTGIQFMLGVDSIHNCSGIQSGALDPAKGMFWAWNTGYVFLKIEGHAQTSTSAGNIFEYHIGGYKQANNCIRNFSLNLISPVSLNGNISAMVTLKADASEIFKTPSIIDFSKLSSITDFHNATTIADNYSDMFSVISGNQ